MPKASKVSKSKSGPSKAGPSKAGPSKAGPSQGGTNKSAFIRSVPASTPANDVVKLASEKGIKINAGLVYAVRSADKNKGGAPKRKPGRPPKSESAKAAAVVAQPNTNMPRAPKAGDLRHQFVSIAVRIGTDEAQRLLDNLVDVQTQISRSVK